MSQAIEIPELQYEHFFSNAEVAGLVDSLARSYPELCRLDSLGQSRQGRTIHLLTITDLASGEASDRPAYLIHGNIHAVELAGVHAALYVAKKLLEDNVNSDLLEHVTFYIIPQINPDGGEFAAKTSTRVRSRTDMINKAANTVYPEDIDGDGLILSMRQEHPDGDLIADPHDARLLIRRQTDSEGPFYRVLPEGMIHAWDGCDHIKAAGLHAWVGNDPTKVGGRAFDWNRNFPYRWKPESEQQGTGDYPLSEPEVRCLVDFIDSRPNIFGILGYHTGYAGVMRPPSSGPGSEILDADYRTLERLGQMGTEETGLVSLPLIELHPAYASAKYRGGHLLDFAYQHLGMIAFDFELGWVVNDAGVATSDLLAVEDSGELDEHMRRMMQWWDRQEPQEPLFQAWTPFDHPQLGSIEIGGFLYTLLDNPSLASLSETLEGAYRFVCRLAEERPQLAVEDVCVDSLDDTRHRIHLRLVNRGRLGTNVTVRGLALWHRHRIALEFCPADGVTLVSDQGHMDLEHLDADGAAHELAWEVAGQGPNGKLCDIRIQGSGAGNLKLTVSGQNRHTG